MKERILKRIQELTERLESNIKDREHHIASLKRIDGRIKDITAILPELQNLLNSEEKDDNGQDSRND